MLSERLSAMLEPWQSMSAQMPSFPQWCHPRMHQATNCAASWLPWSLPGIAHVSHRRCNERHFRTRQRCNNGTTLVNASLWTPSHNKINILPIYATPSAAVLADATRAARQQQWGGKKCAFIAFSYCCNCFYHAATCYWSTILKNDLFWQSSIPTLIIFEKNKF